MSFYITDLFVIYIILVAGTFLGFLIIWPCYERIQHYRLYRRISNFFYLSLAIVALIMLVYYLSIKDWIIIISIPSFITFLFYILGSRIKDLYLVWEAVFILTMFNPVKPVLPATDMIDYIENWILSLIYLLALIAFLFYREK